MKKSKYRPARHIGSHRSIRDDMRAESLFKSNSSLPPMLIMKEMNNRRILSQLHLIVPIDHIRSDVISVLIMVSQTIISTQLYQSLLNLCLIPELIHLKRHGFQP